MTKKNNLVITRIFDAPQELVWETWTDPKLVKKWWGPKGFTAPSIKIDFKVGGKYVWAMHGPKGSEWDKDMYNAGIYKEIVPNKRLVATQYMSDENGNKIDPTKLGMDLNFPKEFTITVLFEEIEKDKTKLSIIYPKPATKEQMEAMLKSGMNEGWNSSLDKLAELSEGKTINKMQKIIPHLWFDKEAKEATMFYISAFPKSKILNITTLHDTPSGDCDIVSFELMGQGFMAISAGPLFKFNPSVSFIVGCESKGEVNELWKKLEESGEVLMPLDKYPFSERYGWLKDKYGLSWQLILTKPEGDKRPKIVPSLLFVGKKCGKAEEAMKFYLSFFKNSKKGNLIHYDKSQEPNKKGTVMFEDFMIENYWLAAMDSALEHNFTFNEAISFIVNCKDQKEIDYYWNKLSAVPEAEQCGWVKDKFGVSWQVIPENMKELMSKNPSKTTPAMLKMKKIIIADLKKAGEEKLNKKEISIAFLSLASSGKVNEAYEKYIHPNFFHHNPYFKGDRESLLEGMEENVNPIRAFEIKKVIEDNELVMTLSHVVHNPKSVGIAVVHIFRFENDKIIEMWDIGQEIPENSPNKNGMF